ncbi:MAG: hypothetical protein JSS81_08830 [Acidobacteria bacterium]|nr:hypothetical protein [Acidobacteriota bacterium]
MDNTFVIGLIGWLFPGGGHLVQKRWLRGTVFAAVFWILLITALLSGGAYYPGFSFKDGSLLYLLNVFGRLGSGIGAVLGYLSGLGSAQNAAAWATFEYGGRFLEVAGLLNYLAVIDAVDIHLGRKR